jgi:hypothetical protein
MLNSVSRYFIDVHTNPQQQCFTVTIRNVAIERNFEIISGKFNAVGISTSRNYALKWVTEVRNY